MEIIDINNMSVTKKKLGSSISHHELGLQIILAGIILAVLSVFLLYCYLSFSFLFPAPSALIDKSLPPLVSVGTLKEEALMPLPSDAGFDEVSFLASPDGLGYAYISKTDDGLRVVLNGEAGPVFDDITSMAFSPDGQRFAYTAKQSGQELAVIDGQAGESYDWIFSPRFFTSDSRYYVYKARNGTDNYLVINNEASRPYEHLYDPFVLSDRSALVFFAISDGRLWRGQVPLEE